MFEIQSKKSGRTSNGSKNNSKKNLHPKDIYKMHQKITVPQIVRTECNAKSYSISQKKNKSQCLSKQPHQPKHNDIRKFIQTSRSISLKKDKQKSQKGAKGSKIITQPRIQHRHQNIFLMNNVHTQKFNELKWVKKTSVQKNTDGRSTQKRRNIWNQHSIPYTWQYTLQNYSHYLTKYEKSQIKEYKKIYYIGHKAIKSQKIDQQGPIFDNQQKQYIYIQNDHIAYRYEILSSIGKGSYGQVYKVFDHKIKEEVAIKIVKNDPKYSKQAFMQIKILSHIKQLDQQQSNVVKIKDFVIFRKHVCIIFQLLSNNLYQLIIRNNYNGLNDQLVRRFAIQLLFSLQFLRKQKIIHCDLKPQNILLKQFNKSGIKIIDFGSSCFQDQTIYTYIQSRYYRAPEITLGVPYACQIDIWSVGCILTQLCTGVPVFPGQNQQQQMRYMIDTLGLPSKQFLKRGNRAGIFFDEKGKMKQQISNLKTTIDLFSKPLKQRLQDVDFLSFIETFLKWDPQERTTPYQALNHAWIAKGLPEELKIKLNFQNVSLRKRWHSKDIENVSSRMKTKSKQKGNNSVVKLTNKLSNQKIKKVYGHRL